MTGKMLPSYKNEDFGDGFRGRARSTAHQCNAPYYENICKYIEWYPQASHVVDVLPS